MILTLALFSVSAFAAPIKPSSIAVNPANTTVTSKANLGPLVDLVRSGSVVTFLNKSGAVVATLNANGTLTLASNAKLGDATTVSVRAATSGGQTTTTNYTLSGGLDKPGQLKVEATNNAGKTQSIALPAAVNRQVQQPRPAQPPVAQPTPTPPPAPTQPAPPVAQPLQVTPAPVAPPSVDANDKDKNNGKDKDKQKPGK